MPSRVLAVVGPLLLAAFTVVGTFGAGERIGGHRPVDVLGVALAVVGPLALLALGRHAVAVLAVCVASTLTYLALDYPYGPVVAALGIALAATAAQGRRGAAWAGGAVAYAGLLALRGPLRDEAWSWPVAGAVAAWVLLVLAVGELVHARRERVLGARAAAAELARREQGEERLRIARELHDVVAHHMSLINVQAGVALHLVDRRPEQAQTALRLIKDASKEALGELRALVGVLRDEGGAAPLQPVADLADLDALVERTRHAGVELTRSVTGDARPLPAAVRTAAYRIVQEAVTNVVRHSGSDRAEVGLAYGEEQLVVRVDDAGRGGEPEPGSGLRGMRERAAALGGSLSVGPSPLGGLRVEARLPVVAA